MDALAAVPTAIAYLRSTSSATDCVTRLILMPERNDAQRQTGDCSSRPGVRFRRRRRQRARRRRHSFDVRPGQTVGIVERRMRQKECDRSLHPAYRRAALSRERKILFSSKDGVRDLMQLKPNGRQMRAIRGREIALVFQEPMTSFSPFTRSAANHRDDPAGTRL